MPKSLIFYLANMSFNTIHKNKILAKISEFTVLLNFDKDHVYGIEVVTLIKF